MTTPPAIPRIVGPFVHLFDPNRRRVAAAGAAYTNDHCLIQDEAGHWHAIGIVGTRPVDAFDAEQTLFHSSGPDLVRGGWAEHDSALEADPKQGERFLWAPHIVRDEGCYWMVYAGGALPKPGVSDPEASDHFGIFLASSPDLVNWTRHTLNPLFEEPGHARDPMLLRTSTGWLLYTTRIVRQDDRRSAVFVRRSKDLLHWSGAQCVHIQDTPADFGRDAESPFVVTYGSYYYLFVCRAAASYRDTRVYVSETPFTFSREVARLPVHAAEVVQDGDKWFITDTGWDKDGLYSAPLEWGLPREQTSDDPKALSQSADPLLEPL